MKLSNLHDLFMHKLADLYSAENQILKALPGMIDKVSATRLKDGLSEHLEKTRIHAERLDTIHGSHPFDTAMTCKGMAGILAEGEATVKEAGDQATRDAAIIAAAQAVEHYEIAAYGSAKAYAKELGFTDEEGLLDDTLSEEYEADKLLTGIAVGSLFTEGVNRKAE